MQKIVGTIRSGSLFEGCGIYGEGLKSLEAWHDAYVRHCGDEADWQLLHAASVAGLQRWYRHEAVCLAVNALAGMLIQQVQTSKFALQSMFGVAQVAHIPDPWYESSVPSAQRWPHNTRTPATSTSVGVDLRSLARDPHGRIRPLTESEWLYAIAHRAEFSTLLNGFAESEARG